MGRIEKINNQDACRRARMALRDTLDVVGGKWKLILISTLREDSFRFTELANLAQISPRILSKELKELEDNGLVNRKVNNTRPVTVEYSLTEYCETLSDVIDAMHKWGLNHRKKTINDMG